MTLVLKITNVPAGGLCMNFCIISLLYSPHYFESSLMAPEKI